MTPRSKEHTFLPDLGLWQHCPMKETSGIRKNDWLKAGPVNKQDEPRIAGLLVPGSKKWLSETNRCTNSQWWGYVKGA